MNRLDSFRHPSYSQYVENIETQVEKYQQLLKDERVALLGVPSARQALRNHLLTEASDTSRSRRINAQAVVTIVAFLNDPGCHPTKIYPLLSRTYITMPVWSALIEAAQKGPADDRLQWETAAKQTNVIRDEILIAAFPWIRKMRQYYIKCPLSLNDEMEGAGLFALLMAMERFAAHRDTKFESYACRIIHMGMRHALLKELSTSGRSRRRVSKFLHAKTEMEAEQEREIEDEEVAEALGLSSAKTAEIKQLITRPISLDEKPTLAVSEEATYHQIIPDEHAEAFDHAERRAILQRLVQAFERLQPTKGAIAALRFSMAGDMELRPKARSAGEAFAVMQALAFKRIQAVVGGSGPGR